MPTFTRKNGRYFVSYITGPSHVLLGLTFGPVGIPPSLIRLPRSGSCDRESLDESRIRQAVLAGIAAAGVDLHPTEIVYCEGDSPCYELFQQCGCLLAQRVASGAEFTESYDTKG